MPGCFSQDFLCLAQEPSAPIGLHRSRFERLFGVDFGAVAIHRSPLGDALCERLGARAFALGDHVTVRRNEGDLSSAWGQALLAHELAHVVQQRHGAIASASPATEADLEREAALAADAVVAGRAFRCRLADTAGRPRAWDYAGHYFTTYLVFLNAGCSNDEARAMATCCWAPDQVHELDAATVGVNDYDVSFHGIPHPDAGFDKRDTIKTYREGYELFARRRFKNHEQYVQVIHKGLHALTGTDAATERHRRREIFRGLKGRGSLFKHALALHAFGDSFAHQRIGSTSLFPPTIGHAFAGGDPDQPWSENRDGTYIDYLRGMVELACFYKDRKPRIEPDDLVMVLSPMLHGTHVTALRAKLSEWEDGARRRLWAQDVRAMKNLIGATVERNEVGCGRHISNVAMDLLNEWIAVPERNDAARWSVFFARNASIVTASAKPTYRGAPAPAFGEEQIVFFEIIDSALEWTSPREYLEPVFLERAQADIQIDGPRRLRKGQGGTYRRRLIGLPPAGRISWSPSVGETKGGLRGAGVTADGTLSVVATEDSGKGVVTVLCEWGERSGYGRLEVNLLPAA
jgi:hypothetical protein